MEEKKNEEEDELEVANSPEITLDLEIASASKTYTIADALTGNERDEAKGSKAEDPREETASIAERLILSKALKAKKDANENFENMFVIFVRVSFLYRNTH
ncbi:hypothetical protein ACJX0J_037805, partial [Zea mays]